MLSRVGSIALILVALSAATASAGWVASAFVGDVSYHGSDLHVERPKWGTDVVLSDVPYEGRSWDEPIYYGFRGGYFFDDPAWLGVEGEFVHAKVYAQTGAMVEASGQLDGLPARSPIAGREVMQEFSMSHGMNFLFVNVAARKNVGRPDASGRHRIVVVGRAGLGPTIPHPESYINGERSERYELGRPGAQVGAELAVRVYKRASVMVEYKFTGTKQRVSIVDGHASLWVLGHNVVMGLSFELN